ncbi:ribosome-associated protein IOJAP [Hydrogenophaga sp. Root209]|uniref:ribosome silencing factor n=1 Tax=unclassified Hydrogenophaga TaxID=2610897 RepID=UPI00070163DF|nr:ribosome silencing factor [Hydrogenophaga sp. Root209]KRC11493.1 ribosome-associated protein IOJAP [Hydrogenophaga sp. Root209]
MTSETIAKKDIQRLQRAIVDGLEDVKGQDIVVFNTEHLSPLFERVIVASGTSNRQTKALAASVRDAVREAGFDKPRIEGEDNGEWIIVDCGAAVAHVMQPVIRQYYRLEEIWGAKPVRLKHGAEKPVVAEVKPAKTSRKKPVAPAAAQPAKSTARKAAQSAARTAAAAPAKTAAKKPAVKTASKSAPAKTTRKPVASAPKTALQKLVVKPRSATKPGAKTAAKPAAKAAPKVAAKPAVKAPARKTTKAAAPRKA